MVQLVKLKIQIPTGVRKNVVARNKDRHVIHH